MQLRRLLPAAILAAAALWWYQAGSLPSGSVAAASPQTAAPSQTAFLIRFGVGEEQPRDWSGRVQVANGRVAKLDGWQFAQTDKVLSDTEWTCSTRRETYWYAPWERSLHGTKRLEKLTEKGLHLRLEINGPGKVTVETMQGEFSFVPGEVTWERPKLFGGGAVVVSRSPAPQRLTEGPTAEDYVTGVQGSDGHRWVAYQSYDTGGDRLWVRRDEDDPVALTEAGADLFGVHLAEGAQGRVWAVWCEQKDSNWDLFARHYDGAAWSATERLTEAAGSDIFHALGSDGEGRLYLAWQSFRSGNGDIYLRIHDGNGWGVETQVSDDPANDWEPDVAVSRDGQATIIWDTYSKGDYDVVMKQLSGGKLSETVTVADSPSFEARATAHHDPSGRLWLAWDEGDADWGKDYAQGIQDAGMGLLMRRQVRVATYEGGQLKQLAGDLTAVLPEEERQVFHDARLASDGGGNLWVLFRYRTNTPMTRGGNRFRSMFRLGATSFQNGRWIPAVEFPLAYGRIDFPVSVYTGQDGRPTVLWASDGRQFPDGFQRDQDLYVAALKAGPRSKTQPKFVAFEPSTDEPANVHPNEAADVARVRDHRVTVGGKTYRPVRGDMHRHTDISWDGNRDGSLLDAYRYALDAAAHDYLGVADHQAGQEVEYSWWMIQKAVDLFTIPGRFTPLYGYERSRGFPSGHRNAMFAQRGVRVVKITDEEREKNDEVGVEPFFQNLRENRGIVMSHTSATGAGTDWSDHDPEVDTLVEIYQGYRRNYEHEGAPRSSNRGSRPAGFVWKAWEKGLKLGVQSSSDHVSTHTSHGMVYVEELTRENIIEGIRARRAYAATDNILVDFRINGHFMGEAFETGQRPKLEAKIAGTGTIRKVEVIKNNTYVHTQRGQGPELAFTYVDNDIEAGEAYYYIRVEQENGELAWASPIWVTYRDR